jgi:hypothetical protein
VQTPGVTRNRAEFLDYVAKARRNPDTDTAGNSQRGE